MSIASAVEDVKTITVNLVVAVCGPVGLWMTVTGVAAWDPLRVVAGLALILLCVLGGVVKRMKVGRGVLDIETHISPFLSWGQGRDGTKKARA